MSCRNDVRRGLKGPAPGHPSPRVVGPLTAQEKDEEREHQEFLDQFHMQARPPRARHSSHSGSQLIQRRRASVPLCEKGSCLACKVEDLLTPEPTCSIFSAHLGMPPTCVAAQVVDVNYSNKGTRTGGVGTFSAMVVVGNYRVRQAALRLRPGGCWAIPCPYPYIFFPRHVLRRGCCRQLPRAPGSHALAPWRFAGQLCVQIGRHKPSSTCAECKVKAVVTKCAVVCDGRNARG